MPRGHQIGADNLFTWKPAQSSSRTHLHDAKYERRRDADVLNERLQPLLQMVKSNASS